MAVACSKHRYCSLCGGPLSPNGLRGRMTAQPGDDLSRCYDDEVCDCGMVISDDEDDYEDEMDKFLDNLDGHAYDCATQFGYNGRDLSHNDIAWLGDVRMLCQGNGSMFNAVAAEQEGRVFLTRVGEYDPGKALTVAGNGLQPHRHGFLFHDTCLNLLHLVHSHDSQRPLSLQRLYFVMKGYLDSEQDSKVSWPKNTVYTEVEEWQKEEWQPVGGREWLVMDPNKPTDFLELVERAAHTRPYAQGSESPMPAINDPFTSLPTELCQMIFDELPSCSVSNFIKASPRAYAVSRMFTNSFWRSRWFQDFAWVDEAALRAAIGTYMAQSGRDVNYPSLYRVFDIESELPCGEAVRSEDDDYANDPDMISDCWELKSRRRIWGCCEDILGFLGAALPPDVPDEMLDLSNFRLATIRLPPDNGDYTRVTFRAIYFAVKPQEIGQVSQLCTVKVYTNCDGSVTGIEWDVESECEHDDEEDIDQGPKNYEEYDSDDDDGDDGEHLYYLLGVKGPYVQTAHIPHDTLIRGFELSLGPYESDDSLSAAEKRTIRGVAIVTSEKTIKLGKWTDNYMVHVFVPNRIQPGAVVGVAGQFDKNHILKFGIITAVPPSRYRPQTLMPLRLTHPVTVPFNTDIYTRWLAKSTPTQKLLSYPSRCFVDVREGMNYATAKWDHILPMLPNPAVYVDLSKQLSCICAFFPNGMGVAKKIGGLAFVFHDETMQTVGTVPKKNQTQIRLQTCAQKEGPIWNTVYFDTESLEKIIGGEMSNVVSRSRYSDPEVCGVKFQTTENRVLCLGFYDNNSDRATNRYARAGQPVLGVHVGLKHKCIESVGLVLA
ncbi:hypothetical protein BJX61DRAFT_62090 [Aspergillus egyptiacus]|nr:hypothetical protein BJX61DRAFT_62090 [Aspergillus egyptiacus]